ncbi:MAG: hypothetical protein Q9217_002640 [Psora testacea]
MFPRDSRKDYSAYQALPSRARSIEKLDVEGKIGSIDNTINDADAGFPQPKPSLFTTHTRFLTVANVLIFALALTLFIGLPYRKPNELNHALRQVSSYSPILNDVRIPLVDRQVQGGLFPGSDQLLGRREPGPETDEIWQNYEIQRNFVLSREEVISLGKDPQKTAKYPDEMFDLGNDAYIGGMDIFHQLHCFDAIRQEAFKDYYWDGEKYHMEGYGPESGPPKRRHTEIFWLHLRHCTDIILQSLMCNADATMTTYMWLETQEKPFPDFSVNRKCRDFGALEQWRDENALDIDEVAKVRKPQDANETKIGEMYWKLYGNETTPGDMVHHPIW